MLSNRKVWLYGITGGILSIAFLPLGILFIGIIIYREIQKWQKELNAAKTCNRCKTPMTQLGAKVLICMNCGNAKGSEGYTQSYRGAEDIHS